MVSLQFRQEIWALKFKYFLGKFIIKVPTAVVEIPQLVSKKLIFAYIIGAFVFLSTNLPQKLTFSAIACKLLILKKTYSLQNR